MTSSIVVVKSLSSLLLLLLLLQHHHVVHAEFNYEVEKRVVERIDDFMNGPRTANGLTAKFRRNFGFPNNLQALDRDYYLRFAYSLLQEFHFDMVYLGLEDGTFMGHGVGWGTYRDPGNSGFPVDDASMAHYYHSCVDRESGADTNCTMQSGSKYIRCVRDCGLMKCADDETQACSKILAQHDGGASLLAQTQDFSTLEPDVAHCFQQPQTTKWCRQYAVEQATQEETHGFIPRTYHCNDARGALTQQPGRAVVGGFLADADDPKLVLGDCEFENGVTKVERWEEGPFVYCGGIDPLTQQPKICDNTFDGGYRSRDYDPRYRGWYMATKESQLPNWSEPYPFFSNLDLGITYSHPIYSYDEQGRYMFEGVLAIDYTFVGIGNFLVDGYGSGESNTIVVVYEVNEPNFMVASSTGRKAATKVLVEDETKPCFDDSARDCKVVRESMANLRGDPLDTLLVKAYNEQRDQDYPRELLTIRGKKRADYLASSDSSSDDSDPDDNNSNSNEEDDEGDELYIVQSSFYRPGGDLEWIILVISPAGKGDADAVTKDNPLFGLICVIASMGFVLCFVMFVLFYRKRHERAVILADWRFTSAFLLGCALLNLSSFTLLGENTDALCLARMWSFHFLFALALSPLFVKVWRMWRMVGAANRRPTIVNHSTAALLSLPIVAISTLILFIFTFADPPHQEEVIEIEGGIVTQHVICSTNTNGFMVIMTLFEAGLIVTGCILAYVTRNLDAQFGEAKQLMFSMYNIGFIGIITTIIIYTMDIDATGEVVLLSIAVFWATVFSSAAFVMPRLMRVKEDRKQNTPITKASKSTAKSKPSNLRNSKVRFSMDDDKSSGASGEHININGGVSIGSEAQSLATAKQSNRSRDFDAPLSSIGNSSQNNGVAPEETAKVQKEDNTRRSIKISVSDSVTSGSGYSDSFIKGTGWTVFEQTDDNGLIGRWSEAEEDDEIEEKEEPLLDVENNRNTSMSGSVRQEHRPSMATIEEVDFSESLRDDFSDDQVARPP
ncbi:two-component hybrid sensor and regulator [Seminavis robusta]|uniref:Two-component hybrid sensor and regulator n=1 Tax=Seminavis robusta TaxID=568900 RepID=A0A9N8DFH4_9STRA|nr:two-component hybrid sensor and regulator [Seminavis robusta]|eukprot:Sro68_g038320.1 two-component hybrid sensor and regulator (1012) ;mRNA; f:117360-120765